MPDAPTLLDSGEPAPAPVAPAPIPDGTPLWNLQTQAPEWVPLSQVRAKLGSGAYRQYGGSTVGVQPGIGGETSLDPVQAATAIAGGATQVHNEAFRDAEARTREFAEQYDNAGDKALAFVDGTVSGLSGGLLDGLPAQSKFREIERAKNQEENSGYKTLGEIAALVASVVAPESLVKFTPLGASNDLFTGASKATEALLAGKVASPLLKKGLSEAAGGAVASFALGTSNAVGAAIQGKPVSGQAIIDDVGLGTAIGFGLGAVGHGLGLASKKAGDIAKQVEAAGRFDESALPIRGALTDVAKSWDSAHNIASARVDALDDLVKSGMLDAEMPGKEWLQTRVQARDQADEARKALVKLAGSDDPTAIAARLHDMAVSGKAKEAEKLYKAFDHYGTAVSHLDDVMQPTTFDHAHLGDVIGDIDLTIPSSEHPYQRLEEMINNGTPQEEIDRFVAELDAHYNKPVDAQAETPNASNVTTDVRAGKGKVKAKPAEAAREPIPTDSRFLPPEVDNARDMRPGQRVGAEAESGAPQLKDSDFRPPKGRPPGRPRNEPRAGQLDEDLISSTKEARADLNKTGAKTRAERVQSNDFVDLSQVAPVDLGPRPSKIAPALESPTNEGLAKSQLLGGSRAGQEEAGFQAKKILDQVRVERGTGVMSPVRPTELGKNIGQLVDQITAATGGRLGSTQARALATELGMNMASLNGPVSQKLADLWALHRMSNAVGEGMKTPRAKQSLLQKALAWGTVSTAGSAGFGLAGPMGAGAARTLARHALGAALYGAGTVASIGGRFRQSAQNGLAKALNPVGRKALGLSAINRIVASSYEADQHPTTDYQTKADQLRRFQSNPQPVMNKIQSSLRPLYGVDPVAYQSAVDAAQTRLKNLANALPRDLSMSMTMAHKGPTEAEKRSFQIYEAVTTDRELVFKYLKSGSMPEAVVNAMQEQHPDYMAEIREYVLNNPDEVKRASRGTQLALSRLIGIPLVASADPAFVQRMQEPYVEAKQKSAQKQATQGQGAGALHTTPPTQTQIFVMPH
jgi:hypothetical protein